MIEAIKEEIKSLNYNRQSVCSDGIPVSNLIQRIQDWTYKTKEFKFSLENVNLTSYQFTCDDLYDFLTHYELVKKANYKFPIILNNKWVIVDWKHRLCKAISDWKKQIDAIQILDSEIY